MTDLHLKPFIYIAEVHLNLITNEKLMLQNQTFIIGAIHLSVRINLADPKNENIQ